MMTVQNMTFPNHSFIITNSPHNTTVDLYRHARLSTAEQKQLVAWAILTSGINFIGLAVSFLLLLVIRPRTWASTTINPLLFHYTVAQLLMSLVHMPAVIFLVGATFFEWPLPISICTYTLTFN